MNSNIDGNQWRTYGYRWVVLGVFVLITMLIEMQWLTFAPVARQAKLVYGVSAFEIDLLSMIFMGIFVVVCIPASYVIDTFGIRIGVGFGAALTGIFGLMKGVFATDYTMIVIAQVGLAVAQPFILNAATKVAVRWFPLHERATAVGIATLAQFLGIVIVMLVTPYWVAADTGNNISGMLMGYGIVSAVGAAVVLALLRERPPTPPSRQSEGESFVFFDGMKHMFKQRDMLLTLLIFTIGLGMFNAISTCIDQICEPKGLSIEQTGDTGGAMLIAGIIGALIFPVMSDKLRKRKPFLLAAMVFMTPGIIGLTFLTGYVPVLAASFVIGLFLLGAGAPIGFQYAAEVSHPAPESSSQGLLLLAGQISGIGFIVGMNTLGVTPFMILFVALCAVVIFLCARLNESVMIAPEPGP